jgi:tRNA(Arg) A34 adenosine deaminase TadA
LGCTCRTEERGRTNFGSKGVRATAALDAKKQLFVAEAARMKREAITSGDQPFGAVVVMGDTIIGYRPSRVVVDRNPNAHAERLALWDSQRRLGTSELSGAVIYSISRPCSICENALAHSNIERMFFGAEAIDAGMNANIAEYHVPVHADVLDIKVIFVEEPDSKLNPMGIKGVGEIGIVGVLAAVAKSIMRLENACATCR